MATSLDLPAPTLAVLPTIVDNAGAHFEERVLMIELAS